MFGSTVAALGYIGPGAGFALASSVFLIALALVLGAIAFLLWPARAARRFLRSRRARSRRRFERCVIIGLDGLDPHLAEGMMSAGRLPNLARLRERGVFARLATTSPALSPVAWSSFLTGTNPGQHGIFDFLARDPQTYLPSLSSSRVTTAKGMLGATRTKIERLRKCDPFWKYLAEQGVFGVVLRVPVTFPPEKFGGALLSGMCVPDIRGTQGTFTYYTSGPEPARLSGGTCITVEAKSNRVESYLPGPDRTVQPFAVLISDDRTRAVLHIDGQEEALKVGEHSPWLRVRFPIGRGRRVPGICRFCLRRIDPHFELYASPVNLDPERPAMPVSEPQSFSVYLAKRFGPFATLGLAEDTSALQAGVIDERTFLEQVYLFQEEREQIFFDALTKTRRGLCVCVFDATDRIQHMFGRPDQKEPIEDLYQRMDGLVGRAIDALDDRSLLIVMSDHGFRRFRREVNLNAWLREEGYLALRPGATGNNEWLRDVDWSKTRAYGIGLTGLYINLQGREAKGIVAPGKEYDELKKELAERLSGLQDSEEGQVAVAKAIPRDELYSGDCVSDAPDLVVACADQYRLSWDSVKGKVTGPVFKDNERAWSGDHGVSSDLVPGVLFCNQELADTSPSILDMAPTVLSAFGVDKPAQMEGRDLLSSTT